MPRKLSPKEAEELVAKLRELLDKKDYDEIDKMERKLEDIEFNDYLCPLVTTVEHTQGLYKSLCSCHQFLEDLFLHTTDLEFIKRIIAEHIPNEDDYSWCISALDKKIAMAIHEGDYELVFVLMRIVQDFLDNQVLDKEEKIELSSWDNLSDILFYPSGGEGILAHLRFLLTYRERLEREFPGFIEPYCEDIAERMVHRFGGETREALVHLIAQPSMLTPITFAKVFLPDVSYNRIHRDHFRCRFDYSDDEEGNEVYDCVYKDDEHSHVFRTRFLKYGWREAVEEGLWGEKYKGQSRWLWERIMEEFPGEFCTDYPPTTKTLSAVLNKLQTKQHLEDKWVEK